MWWLVAVLVVVVALVAFLLARRGSTSLGEQTDAGRPPESFRTRGDGPGNAAGIGLGS
jgi:hypothetical protein